MLVVGRKYSGIQVFLIYNMFVDDLDDNHLAKLIVYLVKLFEKENCDLFKCKARGVSGPKFKYFTSEMLTLYFLLLLEVIDYAVRLKNLLMIKSKPVNTLLMKNNTVAYSVIIVKECLFPCSVKSFSSSLATSTIHGENTNSQFF